MIYLHKFFPLIVSPLFFVLFLILIGLFIKSKKISLFGLLILIICSLPIVSNKLIFYLEKDYKLQNTSNINKADAIVVLSGMIKTIKTSNQNVFIVATHRGSLIFNIAPVGQPPMGIFTETSFLKTAHVSGTKWSV